MRRLSLGSAARCAAMFIAVVFLAANLAQATQIAPGNQYTIHFSDLDQSFGNGGLFQYDWVDSNPVDDYSVYGYADAATWNGGKGFYSFCLEEYELIHFNNDYNAELSLIQKADLGDTAASAGGKGSVTYGSGDDAFVGDPISNATAFLYTMFATGQFGDLNDGVANFGTLTDAQAVKALQDTIWWYEQEITGPISNAYTALVDAYFGIGGAGEVYDALANYDASPDGLLFPKIVNGNAVGRYTVYAVNNTYLDGSRAQDTLFMTYDEYPGNIVPEPTTCLIWGIGLCLAGLTWRKKK